MKTFSILYIFIGIILVSPVMANLKTAQDTLHRGKSLFETVTHIRKQNDFLNVKLNTRMAFHSALSGGGREQSAFRMDYLRLEVTGNVTERIYYKWMQHLNRSNAPHSLDNMPSSIDCLGVGFHITPTLSAFVGKQYADFGGFEYDAIK